MMRPALPVVRTIALALGATAEFVLWVVSGAGSEWQRTVISDCIFPPVVLAAVYQAWRASRNTSVDRGTRRAWGLITAAYLCWCLGDAIWAVYEVGLRQQPFPSLADAGYLLFYPLILGG